MDWFLHDNGLRHERVKRFANRLASSIDPIHNTARKESKYRVISGPYFPTFELNTERYKVSLRIQSEYGKILTRNNSIFGHFLCSANAMNLTPHLPIVKIRRK